jgi:ribosome-binding protein aMBF1 (putative translation factor)
MHVIIEKQWREIVNAELERRGMSRSELGRRIGLSPQNITEYLNARKCPSPAMMERFLRALDLEPRLSTKKIPAETSA